MDIVAFLAVCMVIGDDHADRLLRLAREQNPPAWLQQRDSKLPEQLKTLVDHESNAVEMMDFKRSSFPGCCNR